MAKVHPTESSDCISNKGLDVYLGITAPYRNDLEHDFLVYQHARTDIKEINILSPYALPASSYRNEKLDCTDYVIHRHAHPSLLGASRDHEIIRVCTKAAWQRNWRQTAESYKALRSYSKKQGYVFSMYDESRIRHKAFRNMEYILSHYKLPYDNQINIILNELMIMGVSTIEYVLTRLYGKSSQREHGARVMLHLMATKRIGFDVWADLDEKMEIWHVQ